MEKSTTSSTLPAQPFCRVGVASAIRALAAAYVTGHQLLVKSNDPKYLPKSCLTDPVGSILAQMKADKTLDAVTKQVRILIDLQKRSGPYCNYDNPIKSIIKWRDDEYQVGYIDDTFKNYGSVANIIKHHDEIKTEEDVERLIKKTAGKFAPQGFLKDKRYPPYPSQ